MTKQYVITADQLDLIADQCCVVEDKERIDLNLLLQSLPELTGEPVAWMNHDGDLFPVSQHEKFGSGSTPLYTHAQPQQPITAEDVTDEIRNAFRDGDDDSAFEDINKCLAAAVNAYLKHRGDTK